MNDSNNNIFGDSNVTSSPQNSNSTGINPTPQPSNSINSANTSTMNTNNVFGTNPTTNTSQINQNPTPMQLQNNFNSQMNNNVSNNNISSTQVNPLPNNINAQTTMQPNPNINNNIPQQQNFTSVSQMDDDELLKAFIGNNYEKITTRPFNFAGFFFTTFYMFYRKMFGYALLVFLLNLIVLNVINNFIVILAFNVAVGFLVNKIYLSYAKKKIAIIKASNSQKSADELKVICSNQGGTSVGKIFLGFLAEIGITIIVIIVMLIAGFNNMLGSLFNFDNWDITINGNKINTNDTNNSASTKDAKLVEDVIVSSYSCFDSQCTVTIEESGNDVDYSFSANNADLFKTLGDYTNYVKVNIYYTQKGNSKTIVDYKIFSKSNNEDITNVKNEDELRNKIGLYSIGTHTELFTLTEVGMTGFGYENDKSYTYANYTLIDSKNNEYEMKYIIPDESNGLNLVEGNKYTITFEVVEGTFGYDFYIKSVN